MCRPPRHGAALLLFVVALIARVSWLFHGRLVVGLSGYDQSVYYASAGALLHAGRRTTATSCSCTLPWGCWSDCRSRCSGG